MTSAPTHNQREAVLAQLNASIDSFFLDGGAVQVLPGSTYVPPRPHREPEHVRPTSTTMVTKRVEARLKQLEELRQLARTMTYAQAMAHTGLSQSALVRAASDGKFKFQPNPNRGKGNLGKKLSDPVEDRLKAEQIIAYRNIGLKRTDVVQQMKISYKQLTRLISDFAIDFPTTAEKQAARKA